MTLASAMLQDRFAQRHGFAVDVRSPAYADRWLRAPDSRLPLPDLRHWYREPGLWLPLSCAIARVQGSYGAKDGGTGGGATLDTPSITSTTGNTLVVFTRNGVSGSNGAVSSIVDGTNTFTKAAEDTSQDPSVSIWYAKNITGVAHAIRATWPTNHNYAAVYAIEYSGVDTTAPLDVASANHSAGGTTDLTSDAFTTAQANEVIVLGGAQAAFTTFTAGSSFTLVEGSMHDASGNYGGIEEFITSAVQTTFTAHLTSSGSNQASLAWLSLIAASGGGGGTRGLFRTPALSGLGGGGSFFRDPLQAKETLLRRDRIYVPSRYAVAA